MYKCFYYLEGSCLSFNNSNSYCISSRRTKKDVMECRFHKKSEEDAAKDVEHNNAHDK